MSVFITRIHVFGLMRFLINNRVGDGALFKKKLKATRQKIRVAQCVLYGPLGTLPPTSLRPTNIQPTHSRKSNAHTKAAHHHQEQARLKAEVEAKRTMKNAARLTR